MRDPRGGGTEGNDSGSNAAPRMLRPGAMEAVAIRRTARTHQRTETISEFPRVNTVPSTSMSVILAVHDTSPLSTLRTECNCQACSM